MWWMDTQVWCSGPPYTTTSMLAAIHHHLTATGVVFGALQRAFHVCKMTSHPLSLPTQSTISASQGEQQRKIECRIRV